MGKAKIENPTRPTRQVPLELMVDKALINTNQKALRMLEKRGF